MKRINLYKPSCPLCGKRSGHVPKLSEMLQNASAFLIGLLKVCIMILFLILIGAALFK